MYWQERSEVLPGDVRDNPPETARRESLIHNSNLSGRSPVGFIPWLSLPAAFAKSPIIIFGATRRATSLGEIKGQTDATSPGSRAFNPIPETRDHPGSPGSPFPVAVGCVKRTILVEGMGTATLSDRRKAADVTSPRITGGAFHARYGYCRLNTCPRF